MRIQTKANEQYFHVVLFVYAVQGGSTFSVCHQLTILVGALANKPVRQVQMITIVGCE